MVGLVRCVARQEHRDLNLGRIDKLIIFWTFVGVVAGPAARKCGRVGGRFQCAGELLPHPLPDQGERGYFGGIRFLALIAFPMSLFMCYEAVTKHNLLSILGGVPVMDDIRNGRARAQGAFRHAILAGSFGASLLPLMFALWIQSAQNRSRGFARNRGRRDHDRDGGFQRRVDDFGGGVLRSRVWKLRERMHYFRRGIVLVVIVFALVMKAPVWYLIARLSDLVGGGGWHRAYLIDQFVTHFKEWWLIGTSVHAHWGPDGQTLPNDPKQHGHYQSLYCPGRPRRSVDVLSVHLDHRGLFQGHWPPLAFPHGPGVATEILLDAGGYAGLPLRGVYFHFLF